MSTGIAKAITNLILCCSGQKTFQRGSVGRLNNDNNSHVITHYHGNQTILSQSQQEVNVHEVHVHNHTKIPNQVHLQPTILGFCTILWRLLTRTLSHAAEAAIFNQHDVYACERDDVMNKFRSRLPKFGSVGPKQHKIKLVWPNALLFCCRGGGGGGWGWMQILPNSP